MKIIIAIVLVLLAATVLLKGKSRFVSVGFVWTGRYPRICIGTGEAWVIAFRDDVYAVNEMASATTKLFIKYNTYSPDRKPYVVPRPNKKSFKEEEEEKKTK